jgi:hypothetical protein
LRFCDFKEFRALVSRLQLTVESGGKEIDSLLSHPRKENE